MLTPKTKAFSLVELLITLTVLSILISVAAPAFANLVQKNQDAAVRNLLLAYLQQARAQAVATNQTHTLCGSSNGKTCDGDWKGHWLIVTGKSARVVQHYQLLTATNLCWRGFSNNIRFRANGTAPTSNGNFAMCREQKPAWGLVINRLGRVRSANAGDAASCC